jgi:hypothetical protein
MRTRELGETFDSIFSVLSEHVMSAVIYDMEHGHVYTARDVTDVFDPQSTVYLTDNWHAVTDDGEDQRNVWKLGRLFRDPIIVTAILSSAPTTPSEPDLDEYGERFGMPLVIDGHEFSFDMEWTCACGHVMEPDAEHCGQCHATNPFLGVVI